jgi:hypothetical protein
MRHPSTKVKVNNSAGVIRPATVRAVNAAAVNA